MPTRRPAAAGSASARPDAAGRVGARSARDGVARPRERIFLLCALLTPIFFVALPGRLEFPAGLLTTALIILWLFRGRTLRLLAPSTARSRPPRNVARDSLDRRVRPSRFSALRHELRRARHPVTALFDRVAPSIITPTVTGALVAVVSIGVTMELWKAVQHPSGLLRACCCPAWHCSADDQEPRSPIRKSRRAVASVLRREL